MASERWEKQGETELSVHTMFLKRVQPKTFLRGIVMKFVSSRAVIKGNLEDEAIVLGETLIGERSIVGRNVIIGYPTRSKIKSLISTEPFNIQMYDSISRGAEIGEDCIIRSGTIIYELTALEDRVETGHNVLIREGSHVGEGTLLGSSTKLDGRVEVGKNVSIQSNVYLPHLTVIKDGVFIAPNACFTNDPYPRSKRLAGTLVEKNAIICANSTILPGLKIGENAIVGAGSVATGDVPPDSVVIGSPARFLMKRQDFDEKRKKWEASEE